MVKGECGLTGGEAKRGETRRRKRRENSWEESVSRCAQIGCRRVDLVSRVIRIPGYQGDGGAGWQAEQGTWEGVRRA